MSQGNFRISESIVIGALINDLQMLIEVSDLKIDYFSVDANKVLFKTLKKMYKDGMNTCDIIDILAYLEDNQNDLKVVEDMGGDEYVETLCEIAEDKSVDDIKAHAKTLIDTAYKSELKSTLIGLTSYVDSHSDKPKEYVSKVVESELLELKGKYGGIKKAEMIGSQMTSILANLDKNAQGEFVGIPTSIPLLNKFCTYQKGEMIVIGGLAKFGKSQFVVDQVYWLAVKNKVPVMVLDTELSTTKFVLRMIARVTGYSFGYIASGAYKKNPTAIRKYQEACRVIEEAPFSHTYIVDWSTSDVVDEVKRMKLQNNIQVLFYDYLKVEEVGGSVKEADQLGNLTNMLKNKVAGELDVAVIALAQTSDYSNVDGLRLANSQKIKNYASTVIYLSDKTKDQQERDFNELGGNVSLFISHNRNGSQMLSSEQDKGINLNFNKKNATITQADYQIPEIVELSKEDDYVEED